MLFIDSGRDKQKSGLCMVRLGEGKEAFGEFAP